MYEEGESVAEVLATALKEDSAADLTGLTGFVDLPDENGDWHRVEVGEGVVMSCEYIGTGKGWAREAA